jgi:hypothetical protein
MNKEHITCILFSKNYNYNRKPSPYFEKVYYHYTDASHLSQLIKDTKLVGEYNGLHFFSEKASVTSMDPQSIQIAKNENTLNQTFIQFLDSLPYGAKISGELLANIHVIYIHPGKNQIQSIPDLYKRHMDWFCKEHNIEFAYK